MVLITINHNAEEGAGKGSLTAGELNAADGTHDNGIGLVSITGAQGRGAGIGSQQNTGESRNGAGSNKNFHGDLVHINAHHTGSFLVAAHRVQAHAELGAAAHIQASVRIIRT